VGEEGLTEDTSKSATAVYATARKLFKAAVAVNSVGIITILTFVFFLGGRCNEISRNKEEIKTVRGEVGDIEESLSDLQQKASAHNTAASDIADVRTGVESWKERTIKVEDKIEGLDENLSDHIALRDRIDLDLRCAAFEAARVSFKQICRAERGEPDLNLKCLKAPHVIFISPTRVDPTACPEVVY